MLAEKISAGRGKNRSNSQENPMPTTAHWQTLITGQA